MRPAYWMLLQLYPRDHRLQFADEMLAVFMQAAEEQRAQGRRAYARFLMRECAGLLSGVWREGLAVAKFWPLLGGASLAIALLTAFYAAISNVLGGMAAAVEHSTIAAADPLIASVTLWLWSVAILLCLLPLVFLLSMQIMRQRHRRI